MKKLLLNFLLVVAVNFVSSSQPYDIQLNCHPDPPQDFSQWASISDVFEVYVNGVSSMPVPMIVDIKINNASGETMYSNQTHPFVSQPGPWTQLITAADLLNAPFAVYSPGFITQGTGKLFPSGAYTCCVRLLDQQSMEVHAEACCTFSFITPQPEDINLLFPVASEMVNTDNLVFQWTSSISRSDPMADVRYELTIWEIRSGQVFSEAMEQNPVAYQVTETGQAMHAYDAESALLIPGMAYVWQIRMTGPDGEPKGENDGYSVPEVFICQSDIAIQTWEMSGALCPGNGNKTDSLPFFQYDPIPGNNVTYQLQIHSYIPPTSSGGPTYSLFHTISGLTVPAYAYALNDPVLNPGMYACQMAAILGNQTFFTTKTNFEVVNAGEEIDPGELLEKIDRVRKQLDSLRNALESNPLIEETELIDILIGILSGDSTLMDLLNKILKGESVDISDPQTLVDALDLLEKLLRFLEKYDTGLSDSVKQQLHDLAVKVRYWRMRLKKAIENGEDISEILNEIIDTIKSGSFSGIVDYIKNQILDSIKDRLKAILIKKLGTKAAGALISILIDLMNFTEAMLQIHSIEELTLLYNELILQYLGTFSETDVNDTVWFSGTEWAECTFTFQPMKVCWEAKKDGEKGEGTWEEHTMDFADGSKSKTKGAGEMSGGAGCKPNYYEFNDPVSDASKTCPEGQGPCIVYMKVTVSNCPSAGTYYIFMGVIKC